MENAGVAEVQKTLTTDRDPLKGAFLGWDEGMLTSYMRSSRKVRFFSLYAKQT